MLGEEKICLSFYLVIDVRDIYNIENDYFQEKKRNINIDFNK